MRWFLFWAGGVVIVMVLVVIFIGGLYQDHQECEEFQSSMRFPNYPPESSFNMPVIPEWYIQENCQGIQNDLYMSYYILAIGAALIGIGFVVR